VALGDVRFGAEHDYCLFDATTLLLPVERADATILAAIEPYAERRLAEQGRAWSAVVADYITAHLADPPTLNSACRTLAVSARTLQLRLSDEGTTFSALLDQAQRDRALALLATTDLPITTISAAVGFTSPAVLSRAVRRWTGHTPTHYRNAH
jgi:AraC-like DNA-binding protein